MRQYFVSAGRFSDVVIFEENGVRYSFSLRYPDNTDYQQYLEWLAEGNTPEPWNPEQENN